MEVVTNIGLWIAFGLIAGAVAKFLMPGRDPGGIGVTLLLGLAGALVGGFLGNALGFGWASAPGGQTLLDWRNLVLAIGGALLLLLAYRAFRMLFGAADYDAESLGLRTAHSGYGTPTAPNLTEIARNAVTPDVVQKLSGTIGESPSNTRKSLEAMIPTILAGVANQAATSSGATRLLDQAKEMTEGGTDLITNLSTRINGSGLEELGRSGQSILKALFGDQLTNLLEWFGKFGGIKSSSASSLLNVAINLVMNVIGKQILQHGLSASGLGKLLSDQKGWLSRLLPSGVGEVPGLHALADYAGQAGAAVRGAAHHGEEAIRGAAQHGEQAIRGAAREVQRGGVALAQEARPWLSALLPLLLIAVAVAGFMWLMRSLAQTQLPMARAPEIKVPDVRAPEVRVPEVKGPGIRVSGYGPDLSKLAKVKLPDGVEVEIPETSFLSGVSRFLADKVDTKPRSFVFENLNFDGASVKTGAETDSAVKILSTLVKAYSGVQLRIDGHTDDTGDRDANRQLSLQRANAVKEVLVKAGVPAERISTQGLGSEQPIAPNDTEENRAKNRRIELTLVRK
jgi:outer membrane protein OmpA-like peptidoglycan-associated protein/uncharacterized membrane protein YeaQ/YmgE (transglycosylase-associated protein family)